jgi:hypothetical protein
VMGVMCVVVVARMWSDMPLPHKEIGNCPCNEQSSCSSRIYAHKKTVSAVKHKLSEVAFLQLYEYVIPFS